MRIIDNKQIMETSIVSRKSQIRKATDEEHREMMELMKRISEEEIE